jgi:hypothetical protein
MSSSSNPGNLRLNPPECGFEWCVRLFRKRAIEDAVTDCRFESAGLRKPIPGPGFGARAGE